MKRYNLKILITGANGYIAKNIIKLLREKKYQIQTINRKNSNKIYRKLIKKKFKPQIILHAAGSGLLGNNRFNKNDYYKKNLLSTMHLINFIKKTKLINSKIIFFSSQAVYAKKNNYKIHEEDKVFPSSYYGKFKLLSEKELLKIKKNQIIILRIFSIYGIGLKKQIIWDACKKINYRKTQFLGNGKQIRDFLNIKDFLSLIFKIINDKKVTSNQIYNVGSGKGMRIDKIINKIKKYFLYKDKIIFIKNQHISESRNFISLNKKIKRHYNWKPKRKFNKELNLYLRWFKKNYFNKSL